MADKKTQTASKEPGKPIGSNKMKAALGQALRTNLQKRKSQARARKNNEPDQAPDP